MGYELFIKACKSAVTDPEFSKGKGEGGLRSVINVLNIPINYVYLVLEKGVHDLSFEPPYPKGIVLAPAQVWLKMTHVASGSRKDDE